MALMKFKPITPRFNFVKIMDLQNIPKYVYDYVNDDKIIFAYRTYKDVAIFTNKRIILFNKIGIFKDVKEISSIPYHSIVTAAVYFGTVSSQIKLTLYNVYPVTLRFLSKIDKVKIKETFMVINERIKEK